MCWMEARNKEDGGTQLLLPEHPLPWPLPREDALWRENSVCYHSVFHLDT